MGIQRGPLNNRARIAIVGNAVNAWNNHVNHDAGLPKKYAGLPVNTIETFANGDRLNKPLVTFNRSDNAALRFPGLPPIRLTSCRPLPDDQPTYCSVSVHGKQVKVSLTYRVPQQPLPPDGQWNPTPYSASTSASRTSSPPVPASATLASNSANSKPKSRTPSRYVTPWSEKPCMPDSPATGLYWTKTIANSKPSKAPQGGIYTGSRASRRKNTVKLTSAYPSCSGSVMRQRRAYRHQVAANIVQHCVAHGIQLIALEKLPIPNLTKSGRGTIENPGQRVAQKRGLNRRILEQGWAELTEFIKYKARYHAIRLVQVYASGTSQTCSTCGNRDAKSRKHKQFCCTGCHYQADADHNAALNIGDRGTYIYVKRKGVTLADIRQQRLMLQGVSEPAGPEPETGLGPAPPAYPTG